MSTVIDIGDTWKVLPSQPLQSTGVDDPTGFSAVLFDDSTEPTTTDTFTRANSTTSLGSADTGETWAAIGATWGISSNQAYLPSPVDNVAALLDVAGSDGVFKCDMLYEDSGDGVLFRASGASVNDGFLVYLNNTQLNVLVPGFGAHVTGSPVASAHTPGSIYTIQVVLRGTSIDVYEGGVLKLSASSSTNQTETHVGLRSGGTTAGKRWDNLSWTPDTWETAPGAFGSGGSSRPDLVCPFTIGLGSLGAVLCQTEIGINGEAYYRKHVTHVPGSIMFKGWIDNQVWIFINGTLVHTQFESGGGEFTFTSTLPDPDNVVAIRTQSTGDEPGGGHLLAILALSLDQWHVGSAASGGDWA